ncbi:acyl-CoA dehydrogenase family protein [Rhizorhabdus dicambivorans]|uniref:Acyl-[acyl-carrier-protein] dehydrogenase MbtN n=1 Tax=Rhizorhabdus dicambivorans TaxID=1850238 RepID=A0A2A4FVD1_9SPHN|nr:acyl-CoA dehydrogenase family protein [Rhizorhabdus dicambivorans]ATE64708.1 acyl-CoA dehydrogenase [Rhizorhabdus dicambivorans]PCE41351.1 acyl-CoA dehydrogenase [Rhizorhabdus dicambivorans]
MSESSPWIDEELSLLQDGVRRFIERELLPVAPAWEHDHRVDLGSWKKAAEAGLLCAAIPQTYGGGGGTLGHEAIIQQELVRAGLGGSFAICHGLHSTIVAHYIHAYGTEEQKRRWLPAMARAELIGAIAMTEPGTGSDLQAIRTTAKREGDHYRLDGQKTFISNGQSATLILVVTRTGDAGAGGLSLLAVETDGAEGFRRGRNLEKLGMHGQDTSELFFDDVRVSVGNLLGGEEGKGFVQLMQQLAWERLSIALMATASMERAVKLTTEYVRERKVFGKPLIDFQNTQFVLADAKTQMTVGRSFVDSMMVKLLAKQLDPTTAAMGKLWCSETAFKVIDACQQLFGGYGYMTEYPIARLFADARVTRVYGGASEIMKLIISRDL